FSSSLNTLLACFKLNVASSSSASRFREKSPSMTVSRKNCDSLRISVIIFSKTLTLPIFLLSLIARNPPSLKPHLKRFHLMPQFPQRRCQCLNSQKEHHTRHNAHLPCHKKTKVLIYWCPTSFLTSQA